MLLLLLSLLSKFIPADTFYIPSLLSLTFPFLFLLFVLFTLLVIYRKYYISLIIAFPVLIWSVVVINRYVDLSCLFFSSKCEVDSSIKVMTFNVRLFDRYNWKGGFEKHEQILNFIINQQPDIACFQEYYYQSDGKYPTTVPILKGLQTSYIHEHYTVVNNNRDYFGIATITKFPIIKKGIISFKKTSNICIYSDVVIYSDTVRVFNLHLESVRLGVEDYAFISTVEQKPDSAEYNKTLPILKRLIRSAKKRSVQAAIVADSILYSPYPVIVCGDFNDVPASYTYSKISKGLADSYSQCDFSLGTTYNGKIPFIRIDYILHSPAFSSCNYKIHKVDLSDHYPVSVQLYKN